MSIPFTSMLEIGIKKANQISVGKGQWKTEFDPPIAGWGAVHPASAFEIDRAAGKNQRITHFLFFRTGEPIEPGDQILLGEDVYGIVEIVQQGQYYSEWQQATIRKEEL